MVELVITVIALWLLYKAIGLLFKIGWGVVKIIAGIIVILASLIFIVILITVGGFFLLIPVAFILGAIALLKMFL